MVLGLSTCALLCKNQPDNNLDVLLYMYAMEVRNVKMVMVSVYFVLKKMVVKLL